MIQETIINTESGCTNGYLKSQGPTKKNGKKDGYKEIILGKKGEKKEPINAKKKIPQDKMFIEPPENVLLK